MKLLIAGAGGQGRVAADAAVAAQLASEIAFIDDCFPEAVRGPWPVVGTFGDLGHLLGRYDAFVAGVGNSKLRLDLLHSALALKFECPVIIHPRATVSPFARIEAGSVLFAGSVVNIGATVGVGCIINTGATVDHDCLLAEGVHICPGAHLAGNVQIGARTWFGIGAIAKQGVHIGADVVVGAGAVCVRDIPDGIAVAGVPAQEIKKR